MDDCRTLFRKIKSALDDAEKERKKGNLGEASNHYSLAEDLLNENKRYLDYFDDADRATFQDFQILVAKEYEKIVSDFSALKTRTSENNSRDVDSKDDSGTEPDNLNNPARQNNPRNPAGGGSGFDRGNKRNSMDYDYKTTITTLRDALRAADDLAAKGKLDAAIRDIKSALKLVKTLPEGEQKIYYEDIIEQRVKEWEFNKKIKEEISKNWDASEKDRDKFRDRIEEHGLEELFQDEYATDIEPIDKESRMDFVRKTFNDRAQRHLDELDKQRGTRLGLSKINDIQEAIAEATRIGDLGKEKKDVNFVARAIDLLKQAELDCLEDKDLYHEQYKQVKDLKEKYIRDREAIHTLRNLVGGSPSNPFLSKKLNIFKDDTEKRRDSYDRIGASINAFHRAKARHDKNPTTNNLSDLEEAIKNVRNIKNKEMDVLENLVPEADDAEVLGGLNGLLGNVFDAQGTLKTDQLKGIKLQDIREGVLKTVTNGAENARRRAELAEEYTDRADKQKEDARNLYRDRALTSFRHWGTGGTGKIGFFSDAAEWVGFERNPIETLGNLAATILTVWIVITGIVGPILDVFSFFIPFIGILKVPIYLIAIIILHPFMKTILHPIKKDLHFIAGDPYWYEEGTLADKARKKTYQRFDEEAGEEEEAPQRTYQRTPPVKTKKEINKWADGRVYENKEWKKLPEKQPVKSKKEIKKWAKGRNYGRES